MYENNEIFILEYVWKIMFDCLAPQKNIICFKIHVVHFILTNFLLYSTTIDFNYADAHAGLICDTKSKISISTRSCLQHLASYTTYPSVTLIEIYFLGQSSILKKHVRVLGQI